MVLLGPATVLETILVSRNEYLPPVFPVRQVGSVVLMAVCFPCSPWAAEPLTKSIPPTTCPHGPSRRPCYTTSSSPQCTSQTPCMPSASCGAMKRRTQMSRAGWPSCLIESVVMTSSSKSLGWNTLCLQWLPSSINPVARARCRNVFSRQLRTGWWWMRRVSNWMNSIPSCSRLALLPPSVW